MQDQNPAGVSTNETAAAAEDKDPEPSADDIDLGESLSVYQALVTCVVWLN